MESYDILKVLDLTKSCLNKTKALLSSSEHYNNTELAYLCSYYISLHDLKNVIEEYFLKHQDSKNKKIMDKDLLTKVMTYIRLSAHYESIVTDYFSFELN